MSKILKIDIRVGNRVRTVVNTRGHAVRLQTADGHVVEVPSSGISLPCTEREEIVPDSDLNGLFHREGPVRLFDGITYIRRTYVSTTLGEKYLKKLREENPDGIVLGHIISAQAYPGVCALMEVETHGKRLDGKNRLFRMDRFIIFGPNR